MGNTPLSELHCSHSSKSKRARIMSRPKRCNILDLNDDCCYHIYKFLSILDWCSLRDTCTRFRTISDYCFDRRSGSFKLRHISNTSGKVELSEVKRVLRTFGRYMKTLSINQSDFVGNPNCNVLMLYLDRYCLSLVDLTIAHLGLTLATSEQCSRLFSNLQRLVIDEWEHWNEEAFSDCLPKCRSLTELELDGLFYIIGDKLGDSRMEFLKSFKMSYCLGFRYEAFKRFLTLNCQLTQLKLADLFKDCLVSNNILEDIANSLPKLECLSLQLYTPFMKNALPITRMTFLKKLEIDLRSADASIVNEMISCIAEMSIIEDLHLTSFTCTDESIGLLSSLKCLKILRLSGTKQLSTDMCKRLATGLCGLSEIHISKCRKCNGTSFIEIKEFVLHSPNLKRIAFNMVYDGPRIAPEVFHSLAEIRNRQRAKEILLFFLDDKDIRHIRSEYKSNGMDGKIAEYGNVLKMLPLERDMMYIRRINIECEVDHPEYRIMRWCGVRCNNMPN